MSDYEIQPYCYLSYFWRPLSVRMDPFDLPFEENVWNDQIEIWEQIEAEERLQ